MTDFVITAHRMTIATIVADLSVTPRWRWWKRAMLRRELQTFRAKLNVLVDTAAALERYN